MTESGLPWSFPVVVWFAAAGNISQMTEEASCMTPVKIGSVSNQSSSITCTHYPTPEPQIKPFCIVHDYFQAIPCQLSSLSIKW